MLAQVAVRWSFDSRAVRSHEKLSLTAVAATIVPTTLGVGVAAGCPALLGVGIAPSGVAASLVATAVILCVAAALRSVEVRYLRASRRVFVIATSAQHSDVVREVRRDADIRLVGFLNFASTAGSADRAQLGRASRTRARRCSSFRVKLSMIRRSCPPRQFSTSGRTCARPRIVLRAPLRQDPAQQLTASWFLFDIAEIHRPRVYGRVENERATSPSRRSR